MCLSAMIGSDFCVVVSFNIIHIYNIQLSLSLLLSAFPSCNVSSMQIMAKHGLTFVFCKIEAVFVCSFVKNCVKEQMETSSFFFWRWVPFLHKTATSETSLLQYLGHILARF